MDMEAIADTQAMSATVNPSSEASTVATLESHSARPQTRGNRRRKPPWCRPFLAALRKCGVASQAAAAVGKSREEVHHYRSANPWFAEQWEDALEVHTDRLEQVAIERADAGWEEPLTYRGQLCGYFAVDGRRWVDGPSGLVAVTSETPGATWVLATVRKFDNDLVKFLLRAKRYKDQTDITLRPGAPSAEDAAALDQLRRDALAQALVQVVPAISSQSQ